MDVELVLNKIVEINIHHGPFRGSYKSRIEEIDGSSISFAMPVSKGNLLPIPIGTPVTISLNDQTGIYAFTGVVLARKNGAIPVFTINYPKEIKKIQRRDFVRVDATIKAEIKLSGGPLPEPLVLEGQTGDISGGGAKLIITKEQLSKIRKMSPTGKENGLLAKITFFIPDGKTFETVECVCELLRSGEAGKKCWLTIKIREINERNRDRIIRFVFDKQRELRRKGLL